MSTIPREDLVRALAGRLMSDDEYVARILLGKTGGQDMKAVVTPRKLLEQAGGAAALPLLRDILNREPEPSPGLLLLPVRENVIQVIASARNDEAVDVLIGCYTLHLAWEDSIIGLLAGTGVTVPERYTVLVDVIRPEDVGSLAPSEYARFKELLTHSYLEDRSDALAVLAATAAHVRAFVARALGGIRLPSSTEFLAGVLVDAERSDLVRWSAGAALAEHADPRAVDVLGELLDWAVAEKAWVSSADIRKAVDALAGLEDERARAVLLAFHERLAAGEEQEDLRRHLGERLGLVKPKKGWFRRR